MVKLIDGGELAKALDENAEIFLILRKIENLAIWHFDEDADENNNSPEDMTAHINGLIVKLCRSITMTPNAALTGAPETKE